MTIVEQIADGLAKEIASKLWANVRKTDYCWLWEGSTIRGGYGQLGRGMLSHRVSYEIAHGPIPAGLKVCHHCDNPPCVNPAHLFLGTQRDNVMDAIAKGRLDNLPRGALHHNALKTNCKRGHPFTPDNIIPLGINGQWRKCRACYELWNRNRRKYRAP